MYSGFYTDLRETLTVTADSLAKKVATLDEKIENETDPLKRVDLVQQRLEVSPAMRQYIQIFQILFRKSRGPAQNLTCT